MATKTVAEKAHIKPGTAIAVLNRVPGIVESLGLPAGVAFVEPAEAQIVFLFVRSRAELEAQMPPAVAAGLDMNRDNVRAIAEKMGLRPLGLVSIDDDWSAFRLRQAQ